MAALDGLTVAHEAPTIHQSHAAPSWVSLRRGTDRGTDVRVTVTRRGLLCGLGALVGVGLSRSAAAIPLVVKAASDLRVEPRVSADGAVLTLLVRLVDDRAQRVPGARVTVTLVHDGVAAPSRAVLTDRMGEVRLDVPTDAEHRRFEIEARFEGDRVRHASHLRRAIDLDAPFVSANLELPPEGIALGVDPLVATVTVSLGEVVARSLANLPVALVLSSAEGSARVLTAGVTDAAGRVELTVEASEFRAAGAYALLPRVEVAPGHTLDGPVRALLVHSQVLVGVARAEDSSEGAVLVASVITPGRQPVVDAPLQLKAGARSLVGGRTDSRGAVRFVLPWSLFRDGELSVRAVFDPTAPWYGAAESAPLRVGSPEMRAVPAWWAASALGGAMVSLAGVHAFGSLRKRAVPPEAPATPSPAPRLPERDQVERVAVAGMKGCALHFRVLDRATGRDVEGVTLSYEGVEAAPLAPDGVLHLDAVRRVTFVLRAPGYAPREVPGDFVRPGQYNLQVAMRSWREELHERIRPSLGRVPQGVALRTPREALGAGAGAEALLGVVEVGCYGPENPSESEADRVASLVRLRDRGGAAR